MLKIVFLLAERSFRCPYSLIHRPAETEILRKNDRFDLRAELPGQGKAVIRGGVIHQNYLKILKMLLIQGV